MKTYVVLVIIVFTVCIGIGTYLIYYKYMNHDNKTAPKYDYVYQTSNYQYKWEISKK